MRVPYDVKDQRIRYSTLAGAPYQPPYGDIHHRTETLRGLADGDLLLLWSPPSRGASHWRFGIGTTLPFGNTVPDPVALGRLGEKHQHLQFGSGVFAPEAEIAWSRPWSRTVLASAIVQATLPLDANGEGFRPPKNVRWSVGPTIRAGRAGVSLSAAGQYQTVGRWNGETDEGTGFSNGGLRLQISVPVGRSVTVAPSLYREVFSRGFNDETFSQESTVGVTFTRAFGK